MQHAAWPSSAKTPSSLNRMAPACSAQHTKEPESLPENALLILAARQPSCSRLVSVNSVQRVPTLQSTERAVRRTTVAPVATSLKQAIAAPVRDMRSQLRTSFPAFLKNVQKGRGCSKMVPARTAPSLNDKSS